MYWLLIRNLKAMCSWIKPIYRIHVVGGSLLESRVMTYLLISGFCLLILNCNYNLEKIYISVCVDEDSVISIEFHWHTAAVNHLYVIQVYLGTGNKAMQSMPSKYLWATQEQNALTPVICVRRDWQLQWRAILGNPGLFLQISPPPELWLETVMVAAVYCKKAIRHNCWKSKWESKLPELESWLSSWLLCDLWQIM